ncbi:MAG: hypothetical protein ACOCX4_02965 [Planctomycetota bacterium]
MRYTLVSFACVWVLICAGGVGRAGDDPEPGNHRNLKCPAAEQYTYDLYVPAAYAEHPEKRFPVLFATCPYKNPHGYGMQDWAEKRGVLLVSVNDNENGQTSEEKTHIFKAVLDAVTSSLRVHGKLRFGIGQSGGGASAQHFAHLYPQEWAGVVMLVHSGTGKTLPEHIALAMLASEQDEVHSIKAVRSSYRRHKRNGNPLRIKIFPDGGHDLRAQEDKERMMDWMLAHQMVSHPFLTPEERDAIKAEILARLAAVPDIEDPAMRRDEVEFLFSIPGVFQADGAEAALNAWFDARLTMAAGRSDPVEALRDLCLLDRHPWTEHVERERRKTLDQRMDEVRKDKDADDEYKALRDFAKAEAMVVQAAGDADKLQKLAKAYAYLAQKYEGSSIAKDALQRSRELKALL